MDDFAKEGGVIILSLILGFIANFVRIVVAAKYKGDKDPFSSAFIYLLVGAIGGVALHLVFPIFGFFIGFAITMKLIFWNAVSFWDALLAPITVAILALGYFIGIAWFLGGLSSGNILFIALGGIVCYVMFYNYLLEPFMFCSREEPKEEKSRVGSLTRSIKSKGKTFVGSIESLSTRQISKKPIKVVEKITGKVYVNCVKCKRQVRIVSEEITPKHLLYKDFKHGNAAFIGDKRLKDIENDFICEKCFLAQITDFWKKQIEKN